MLITLPSISMSPSVIVSSPATILSIVDLPQPDGPTKTINSPFSMAILTPQTASAPFGYTFLTLFNLTVAIIFHFLLGP